MSCIECNKKNSKYKCPNCYAKYCSVACCKTHKAKECSPVKIAASDKETELPFTESRQLEEIEKSKDYVPLITLEKLDENEEVKSLLYNPHLRNMMRDLVASDNPASDMDLAMREPIFLELADACLKVVEGDKKDDGS